jgi:hypothetical protein
MAAIARVISRATGVEIDVDTLRPVLIFCRRRSVVLPSSYDLWSRSRREPLLTKGGRLGDCRRAPIDVRLDGGLLRWRAILASIAVTVRNAVSCYDVSPSSKSPVIGPTAMYSNSSAAPAAFVGLSARLSKLLSPPHHWRGQHRVVVRQPLGDRARPCRGCYDFRSPRRSDRLLADAPCNQPAA